MKFLLPAAAALVFVVCCSGCFRYESDPQPAADVNPDAEPPFGPSDFPSDRRSEPRDRPDEGPRDEPRDERPARPARPPRFEPWHPEPRDDFQRPERRDDSQRPERRDDPRPIRPTSPAPLPASADPVADLPAPPAPLQPPPPFGSEPQGRRPIEPPAFPQRPPDADTLETPEFASPDIGRQMIPLRGFTGAKVFVWTRGCPIGEWLLRDLKANRLGWTCGPGPQFDFWEVRVEASREKKCPLILYYDHGRRLPGAVHGYRGACQLPSIFAKHPRAEEDAEKWRSSNDDSGYRLSVPADVGGEPFPVQAPDFGELSRVAPAPVFYSQQRGAPRPCAPASGPYLGGTYGSTTNLSFGIGWGF